MGEYLEVDSAANTIMKAMNTGLRVNCFHNWDKENNVFRKISPEKLNIDWSGKFDFDLILYEEDESYEKNYLIGKYGAIPNLKSIAIFKED